MQEVYSQLPLPTTKRCTLCREAKSLDDYHAHPTTRDRKQSRCKDCAKKTTRTWYWEHREIVLEQARAYYQANIKRIKARTYEQSQRWYQENRERARENGRRWQANNHHRVRAARRRSYRASPARYKAYHYAWIARRRGNGGSFTEQEWLGICARYEFRCLCCHKEKPLTADHVIPVSRGGRDSIDNIQPLCQSCNSAKGTRSTDFR